MVDTVTMILGEGSKEDPKESPVDYKGISYSHPAILNDQGDINVHDFQVNVRIPTERRRWNSIWNYIRGQIDTEAVIISPNGEIAKSSFYKRIDDVLGNKTGDGVYSGEARADGLHPYKVVDEDTSAFWLLDNNEFRRDLISKGWFVFPNFEEVESGIFDSELYGLHGFRAMDDKVWRRKLDIKDLAKVAEIVGGGIEHSDPAKDLGEIARYMSRADLVGGRNTSQFIVGNVGESVERIQLYLSSLESLLIRDPKENQYFMRQRANIVNRVVLGRVHYTDFGSDGFSSEENDRIIALSREYIENNNLKGKVRLDSKNGEFIFECGDIGYIDFKIDRVPETGTYLEQARLVKKFVLDAADFEKSRKVRKGQIIRSKARTALGLKSKVGKV
jgi:hypothetical protein